MPMSWMFMPHRALTPAPLVALLAAAVLCARLGKGHGASMVDVVLEPAVPAEFENAELEAAYASREERCDWFVDGEEGSDDGNLGLSRQDAFETLGCALDPTCNGDVQSGDVVCLLPGIHLLDNTIQSKLAPESKISIIYAQFRSTIFNAYQTSVTFEGIVFRNGAGASGAAVYGERHLSFTECVFVNNTATVHGGAIMGARLTEIRHSHFLYNKARFAGAVRINDIGVAEIEDSVFVGNTALGRGGAVVTQIEDGTSNYVKIRNTIFCRNFAPMGENVYDYRSTTHRCTGCRINPPLCCSSHGAVTLDDSSASSLETAASPNTISSPYYCDCDEGWSGPTCAIPSASGSSHEEL